MEARRHKEGAITIMFDPEAKVFTKRNKSLNFAVIMAAFFLFITTVLLH